MADIYYKIAKTDSVTRQMRQISSEMADVAESLKEQREVASEVEKQINDRKKEVIDIQQEVKNHNTQAITVLRIFSCVVFAFTGGFSMITSSLNNLSRLSKQKSFLFFSVLLVLCTALIDTIYMLLRAARNYSSTSQGHLSGFVICNVICCIFAIGLFLLFLFCSFP